MLGVPSLPPSFAIRLCLGESVDSGGRFCCWGCDCTDEEEEWAVCGWGAFKGFVRGGADGGR